MKLWVGDDGTVLKQEVSMLNSKIQFLRMSPKRSEEYAGMSEMREGALVLRGHWRRHESDDRRSAVEFSPTESADAPADEPQVEVINSVK